MFVHKFANDENNQAIYESILSVDDISLRSLRFEMNAFNAFEFINWFQLNVGWKDWRSGTFFLFFYGQEVLKWKIKKIEEKFLIQLPRTVVTVYIHLQKMALYVYQSGLQQCKQPNVRMNEIWIKLKNSRKSVLEY